MAFYVLLEVCFYDVFMLRVRTFTMVCVSPGHCSTDLFFCVFSQIEGPSEAAPPLLTWDIVHEKMPWSIILLLGGGFALAHGSEVSLTPHFPQWNTFRQPFGHFVFFPLGKGVWAVQVVGGKSHTPAEHPSFCYLHPAVSAGGHVHGMFQQHCYHHSVSPNTRRNGGNQHLIPSILYSANSLQMMYCN